MKRPERGERPKPLLGGREFPVHQFKTASRFAAAGAIVALFLVPMSISAFQANDPTSVKARPGLIVIFALLAVWTFGWLINAIKYRALIRTAYDRNLLVPGGGWRVLWANRARWVFTWAAALSWAAILLSGHRGKSNEYSISVSLWLALAFTLIGILALMLNLSMMLSGAGLESEAARLEKARGLRDDIRDHEAKLEDRTDSIAQSLAERITARISDLEALSGQIGSAERKRELIQTEVDAEMRALNQEIYGASERKARRQQWWFVALSFILGFVVNWLSDPIRDFLLHKNHF